MEKYRSISKKITMEIIYQVCAACSFFEIVFLWERQTYKSSSYSDWAFCHFWFRFQLWVSESEGGDGCRVCFSTFCLLQPEKYNINLKIRNLLLLFISWRNAVACIVFHDVIDILSIWTVLGVFVEEKHVCIAKMSACVQMMMNFTNQCNYFRHTVFRIHYIMAVLVFLKSLSLMFHSINFHFIEVKGEHIEAWAILYYITHLWVNSTFALCGHN